MKGEIKFIKSGLFTSLQDLGRKGFRNLAIPNGGALDTLAAQSANLLLNNPLNAAVLECTQIGPVLQFNADCQIALSGAQVNLKLNGNPLSDDRIINISEGDILDLQKFIRGNRLYIGIKNGFYSSEYFGSCSPIKGVHTKIRFEKNDIAKYSKSTQPIVPTAKLKPMDYLGSQVLKSFPGPEYSMLNTQQKSTIKETIFRILPTATRMAFPLHSDNDFLENEFNMMTSPVIPGTIQLTPSGQLIVLMKDAQTTGGYPRVLVLPNESICRVAQLKIGDGFQIIIEE